MDHTSFTLVHGLERGNKLLHLVGLVVSLTEKKKTQSIKGYG